MKKFLSALCLLFVLILSVSAASAGSIPDALRFTQEDSGKTYIRDKVYTMITYPDTANAAVDEEMRVLLDRMYARGLEHLPSGVGTVAENCLDVGAQVFRTGSSWMSFLSVASIAWDKEQVYVDAETRVYDMETGSRVRLTDVLREDSAVWDLLSSAVRQELTAYWPNDTADGGQLALLCRPESLKEARFTMSPGRLTLHYRADEIYPGKTTLMHVSLSYASLREYMTPEALSQTDNSRYDLVALTFDDGPNGNSTLRVLQTLRRRGAQGTFFMVGTALGSGRWCAARSHDALHDAESHNWVHVYEDLSADNVKKWKEKFDNLLISIIGKGASYMRAPGGYYRRYISGGANLPMIQWSVTSTDPGSDQVQRIAGIVRSKTKPGSVVLFHDLNPRCSEYLDLVLQWLEENGYLCVTVSEMFEMYGDPLRGGEVYYDCEGRRR
ncbi:MAG: polysaccharide deacetylase family protein [Clostridia bacterium]|nr:polysaccharide deacetylase family protein [Clostridia bacterium]